MPRWFNVLVQSFSIIATTIAASPLLSTLDPNTRSLIVLVVSCLQGVTAIVSHAYNTDGTPQTTAKVD